MADEINVPCARAIWRYNVHDIPVPQSRAEWEEVVDQNRFGVICEMRVLMASRGLLAKDGWELVEGWMAFEPRHADDDEWAVVWVAVGSRDPDEASIVLREALQAFIAEAGKFGDDPNVFGL